MITLGGVNWTSPEETHEMFDFLSKKYGAEIVQPACRNEWQNRECGQSTCYIVEQGEAVPFEKQTMLEKKKGIRVRFKRPGLQLLMKALTSPSSIPFYEYSGLFYFPIQLCNRCNAAREGWEVAHFRPADMRGIIAAVKDRPLTGVEQDEYRNVFMSAFNREMSKQSVAKTEEVQKGARYAMGKGR